jgi:Na+/phosphate symporter
MTSIWKVLAEVRVEPGDLPSGSTEAFTNIVTWGDSAEEVERKISDYLSSFKWQLLSMEEAAPIDENLDYGEAIGDMIERTRENPKAIILGSFFSYPPTEVTG